jgi:hypothetical protein
MMGLSLSVVNPTTVRLRAAGVNFPMRTIVKHMSSKCAGEMTDGDRRRCTRVES